VLSAFALLQREYAEAMAVVQAVRGELAKAAPPELLAALDRILVNEAQVVIRTVEKSDGGGGSDREGLGVAGERTRA